MPEFLNNLCFLWTWTLSRFHSHPSDPGLTTNLVDSLTSAPRVTYSWTNNSTELFLLKAFKSHKLSLSYHHQLVPKPKSTVVVIINAYIQWVSKSLSEEKRGLVICQLREGYIMTKIKAKTTLTEDNSDILFRPRTKRYLGGHKKACRLLLKDLIRRTTAKWRSINCSTEGLRVTKFDTQT